MSINCKQSQKVNCANIKILLVLCVWVTPPVIFTVFLGFLIGPEKADKTATAFWLKYIENVGVLLNLKS